MDCGKNFIKSFMEGRREGWKRREREEAREGALRQYTAAIMFKYLLFPVSELLNVF